MNVQQEFEGWFARLEGYAAFDMGSAFRKGYDLHAETATERWCKMSLWARLKFLFTGVPPQ